MIRGQKQTVGFTIVELLIVVVVIAILAAITVVAYSGIRDQAAASAVQAQLDQVVKKIELFRAGDPSERYPTSLAIAGAEEASGDVTINYYPEPQTRSFCAEGINGDIAYSVSGAQATMRDVPCAESGLAAWLPMNGDMNDASGNGINGAVAGSVTLAQGQGGQPSTAYSFPGSSVSNISLGSSTSLAPEYVTYSLWINPTSWSQPTATALFAKRNSGSGIFVFYLSGSNSINIDRGSSSTRMNTGYNPPLNQWQHLVVVAGPSYRALYVDGALEAESSASAGSISAAAVSMTIGYDNHAGYPFAGRIDDFRVYDRYLGASEIQALYDAGAQ